MIDLTEEGQCYALELGSIIARLCVNFETMVAFSPLQHDTDLPGVLDILSHAKEFQDVHLRRSEKKALNSLNPTLKFPIDGKVKDNFGKVNILIQAALGNEKIVDWSLNNEVGRVRNFGKNEKEK